jgi:hypothetical protein
MRYLNKKEIKQRGCLFCADHATKRLYKAQRVACPHSVCPYRELDGYKRYADYLKTRESEEALEILRRL